MHCAASRRVVQFGVHVASSVSLCQAHTCSGGSSGVPISDWPQMCPAWYAAFFTFCCSACSVDRMLSILRFWVNICFLASFTLLRGGGGGGVRWYRRTTTLSNCIKSSVNICFGACDNRAKIWSRWDILHQIALAVLFPTPRNAETVSHPKTSWKKRSPQDASVPNLFSIRWHEM